MSKLRPSHYQLMLGALLLWLQGCGYSIYEERLQKSVRFYEYLQKLDQNLATTPWKRPDVEMSMRVPLPFGSPMPAPPPARADAEGVVEVIPDNRHPFVLGIELDGLVDAWQTQLPDANGGLAPALLYVVTNQSRFLGQGAGAPPPDSFLYDLEATLATAFQVTIPEGESTNPADNVRLRVFSPPTGSQAATYSPRRSFMEIHFVPPGPVGGQNIEGLLYEFEDGQIKGALLAVYPAGAPPQLRDRMLMALQTLHFPNKAPSAAAAGGLPAAGSSASGF